MTIDAKAHRVIHNPLGYRHGRHITVAGRALDVGANVRRMIELHVRGSGKPVHPLPGEVEPLLLHRGDLLNARLVGRDGGVADQAGIDAGQSGLRAFRDALVTILEAGQPLLDVNVVWELDGLDRLGLHPEEIIDRRTKRRPSGRENWRVRLRRRGIRRGVNRRGSVVEKPAPEAQATGED